MSTNQPQIQARRGAFCALVPSSPFKSGGDYRNSNLASSPSGLPRRQF